MSDDTPRTDAAAFELVENVAGNIERTECVPANFARAMERECARLRVALSEVITAARNSIPRPHPTIERNADLAGDNAQAEAPL